MEVAYGSFYVFPAGPPQVLQLIAVNIVTYLLLALCVRHRLDRPAIARYAPFIIATGIVFRLTLVPHGVVGSDDIYRYLWDGKVAASGINPYRYLPRDPHLVHLATADLPGKVNHPELRSIYPASAQALFCVSSLLFGDSVAGIKFLLVLLDACTLIILYLLLGSLRQDRLAVLLYAWSPVPVLYFGLDGHIDALGITLLVLALYFLCTNRFVRGMTALGASALAKFIPLLVAPLLARRLKGYRRWLFPAIPVLMTALGSLMVLAPAWGGMESLRTFGEQWEFNGSVFSVMLFMGVSNDTAHLVSMILIVMYIGSLTLIDRPLVEKVFWAFLGVILLSPVVHPWYLTWLAALLVLRWSTAAFVFLGLSTVANVVVFQYQAYGRWIDQPLLLLIEYVPVMVLLAWEIARGGFLKRTEGETA